MLRALFYSFHGRICRGNIVDKFATGIKWCFCVYAALSEQIKCYGGSCQTCCFSFVGQALAMYSRKHLLTASLRWFCLPACMKHWTLWKMEKGQAPAIFMPPHCRQPWPGALWLLVDHPYVPFWRVQYRLERLEGISSSFEKKKKSSPNFTRAQGWTD